VATVLDTGLTGKRALVTGGARGIGFAIASALAREGARLAIADLDPDPEALAALDRISTGVVPIRADVGSEAEAVRMVEEAEAGLGGIDLFVSNAGAAWHEPVTKITGEAFYKTLNTNLAACVWGSRETARHMVAQRAGAMLVVGSTVRFCPAYREGAYRAAKTGLKAYMETLALELAPFGIRVNMLTPGHYPTRINAGLTEEKAQRLRREIPLRRFGSTDELGPAALFLLSNRLSSYITGAEIVVDGGLALRALAMHSEDEIVDWNSK
jgi:NAD(P)-dependent dehydrogenase (short-subunit alcohol dehydrogenase family)